MDYLSDEERTNIFELVYKKGKKGLRHRISYSYGTIISYPEVWRIAIMASLVQTSGYVYLFTLTQGETWEQRAMVYFFAGSIVGLLIMIAYSHFLFR